MANLKKSLIVSLIVAFIAALGGCAEERAPRSYVQPNVLAKSDFTGEWYYLPTVVDIGFASTVTFIGETSMDIPIIKWDLQEHYLFARLAYDRIDGAEFNTHDGWEGEIIGAWPVEHFDIIRDYNATTGEEINVIRETKERPWYEREFIRVNWSSNKSESWAMFWPNAVNVQSIGYSTTDPNDPYYPKYVRNNSGELNYIGVTDKVIMGPEMRSLEGWDFMGLSQIPDCFFYGTTTSCNSSQILVRHAFWKKNNDNEYEPRPYTQKEMDQFGFFYSSRLSYNRQYGVLIQELKQYANRWNFYKESFKKATTASVAESYADYETHSEVNGELYQCPGGSEPCRYLDDNSKIYIMGFEVTDTNEVESSERDAVQCPGNDKPCFYKNDGMIYIKSDTNWLEDKEHAKPVTMRYSDRVLRPIVYYLNKDFPDTIWGVDENGNKTTEPTASLKLVIDDWANAHAIWLDKLNVNRHVDPSDASSPLLAPVMVCPYVAADTPDDEVPYAYGSQGTIKCERDIRVGDFRYPQINWVDAPQQSSPLGYGPALPDPVTGESISMVANIYGAPLDWYSAYSRDLIRLLTDDNFVWDEYLLGDYQASWVEMNKYGTKGKSLKPATRLNWDRKGKAISQDRIKKIFRNMDTGWAHNLAPEAKIVWDQGWDAFKESFRRRVKAIGQTGALGDGTGTYLGYSRLNMLRNTPIEDKLMTKQVLMANASKLMEAGFDPIHTDAASLPYNSQIRNEVSPLTTLNLRYIKAINKRKFDHFKKTIMYSEFIPFEDPASYGVAKELVDSLCGGTWDDGQGGKTCADAIYKNIRQQIFHGVTIHEMGHNMGLRHNFKGTYDAMNFFDSYWTYREHDGTVGPRTSDPITQYEIDNKLEDYAYTSIMDYGAKFNSDWQGLGKYDLAAINYTYADLRQVFKTADDLSGLGIMQHNVEWGWPTAMDFSGGVRAVHYTEFPSYADLSDGNREWVPDRWIIEKDLGGGDSVKVTDPNLDPNGSSRFMVPFMFCSDEFRQIQLGCNYFDKGADLYEITQTLIEMYENYYVLNNFSRGRYTWGWDTDAYVGRVYGRYFDVLQNHAQYYILYLGIFTEEFAGFMGGQTGVENFFSDSVNGWGGWTVATADIFSTFMRVLTMPSPGWYEQVTGPSGESYYKQSTEDAKYCAGGGGLADCKFFVPIISGKYIDDAWDYDYGYEWYMKLKRRGQFFDRPLAMQVLAEATNNFLGRDTQTDLRQYTINFARLYPNQIMDYFAGLQVNDFDKIAPAVCGISTDGHYTAVVDHPYAALLDEAPCTRTSGTFLGRIDPNNTFTIQLYGATLGMAMFPMNYSQSFIDKSRVYVMGNGEGIDWDTVDATDIAQFEDPFSKKIFVAFKYDDASDSDGNTYHISIGSRMIEYANSLKTIWENAKAASEANPSDGALYDAYQLAERNFIRYIDNLELVRGLTRTFEWANF